MFGRNELVEMGAGEPELEAWCEEWSRLWCEAVVRKDAGGNGGEAAEVFHTPWAAAIPLMAIGQPRLMASCYHEMAHNAARTSAGVLGLPRRPGLPRLRRRRGGDREAAAAASRCWLLRSIRAASSLTDGIAHESRIEAPDW